MNKQTLFVDADSCPVIKEIVEIASKFSIEAVFVASYAHMKNDLQGQNWVFVDSHKEAVDLYLMNHVKKGDFAVTQDIGLASTLLAKGVYAISPRGTLFEEKGIGTALELRHLSAKARRQGFYGKGPKAFTEKDRAKFIKELSMLLSNFKTCSRNHN
ncbi:YaiI/YqxD family protein [Mesobacillus subterraneus]|uniref:UPF0178 protein EJA10_20955 n=1 Tax=Mesobacillus subterraneus TaxID=285983 RepID=A0A427THB6_9BACI|nr:DUF188 domain-containing protein [Mesobacillus subterraneus]RSD22751.1 DUF188 domain-containing protein [Mesobacillus subterraneus]